MSICAEQGAVSNKHATHGRNAVTLTRSFILASLFLWAPRFTYCVQRKNKARTSTQKSKSKPISKLRFQTPLVGLKGAPTPSPLSGTVPRLLAIEYSL